jgi:hypothetical protein
LASNCSCAAGSRLFSSWISAITAFSAWGSRFAVVAVGVVAASGGGVVGVVGEEREGCVVGVVEVVCGVAVTPFCFDDQGDEEHPATARPAANVNQNVSGDRTMQRKPSPSGSTRTIGG